MTADEDLPPIPAFDPRMTRRAVRRGLLRTASRTIALLLAGFLILNGVSALIQFRGDRDDRMQRVLGTAFLVAHPDYSSGLSSLDSDLTSMTLTIEAEPREPRQLPSEVTRRPGAVSFEITQNLLGHVTEGVYGLQSKLTEALGQTGEHAGSQQEAHGRAEGVFGRLPKSLLGTAVVEFERPLTGEEFEKFYQEHYGDEGPGPDLTFLLSPAGSGSTFRMPLGWSSSFSVFFHEPAPDRETGLSTSGAEAVKSFQNWVGQLRDHDAANLKELGLSLDNLRKASSDGRIYGYVTAGESVDALRKTLDDPKVRTVRLGDVAFDLT
ncbi:hypothetical protein [Streptosporangium sp. 'caverna']|uniref:hypothetical protein n=1 Tax=Streptosporangium sp. 'caverna' TaxID=2202249 RepID=UPI000D7E79E1|nr:hypothetical protein [Streptosporangium sp. 'caverna']AWS40729.1 hypothetical protein DKM19_04565 [Streptosporangium sp. 'caverna']